LFGSATGKEKISPFPYPVLPPEICNMIFFKSRIPQIYQTVEMDEDEEGAYIFKKFGFVKGGFFYTLISQEL
jgi:hypothetical protein